MKKVFEKIVSITLGVVSTLFVILILVTMFGGIETADLDNDLVHALLIALGVVFAVLTGLNIYASFIDNEKLSAVLLFKDKESATKATVSVLKKTAIRVTKQVPEAKIKKVHLTSDENGNVKMRLDIKISTDETLEVVTRVRAIIIETFKEIFGIEFASIDYKIIKSKNTFVPSEKDVDAKVEELKKSVIINKPQEAPVFEETKEEAEEVQEEAIAEEVVQEIVEDVAEEAVEEEIAEEVTEEAVEETIEEAVEETEEIITVETDND